MNNLAASGDAAETAELPTDATTSETPVPVTNGGGFRAFVAKPVTGIAAAAFVIGGLSGGIIGYAVHGGQQVTIIGPGMGFGMRGGFGGDFGGGFRGHFPGGPYGGRGSQLSRPGTQTPQRQVVPSTPTKPSTPKASSGTNS